MEYICTRSLVGKQIKLLSEFKSTKSKFLDLSNSPINLYEELSINKPSGFILVHCPLILIFK